MLSLLWYGTLFAVACYGQAAVENPLPRFGVIGKLSTLGAGIEAATAVTHRSNFRVGFNAFHYSADFASRSVTYRANLRFYSAEVLYDQYLIGPFHVSPGVLFHAGDQATATAVPSNDSSFSLAGKTLYNSPVDPARGTGSLRFQTVSPMLMFGVGNLLPRGSRHFAVGFETGIIWQGPPKATLQATGSACNSTRVVCQTISSIPWVRAGIQSEERKIGNEFRLLRFYPVVSIGFGYKF